MTREVRQTDLVPPFQAAIRSPGVVFEAEDKKKVNEAQWAAFFEGPVAGHITYREGEYRVLVSKGGYTKYSKVHAVYVTALAALQRNIGYVTGSEPRSRPPVVVPLAPRS
jgi:hypothetical protein